MSDFLINTAQHKRWMLPDGKHYYNAFLYGDRFTITVVHQLSREIVLSHTVIIDAEGAYKKQLELSQELANRRFGRKHSQLEPFEHRYSGKLGSRLGRI